MGPDSHIGVYVHWPFCLAKCPYCDFNSHVAEAVDQGAWRRGLLRELDHYAGETADRTVASIFFGGGTPSLMEPATAAALIAAVGERWRCAEDLEVTLEANPTSAESGRFADFAGAGVNRVSIGVQSLDDARLAFLGRGHSAAEARRAVESAAALFPRFSFDLMYALPGQSAAGWRAELAQALALAGGHMSVYQLTIEPGTAFHREGVAAAGARLFEITQEVLAAAGLPAYEVSNHAAPGAECRHNLAVWRGADYIGVGPGAHGRVSAPAEGGWRTWEMRNRPAPDAWLAAVAGEGHGAVHRAALSPARRVEELLMTGLRLSEGVKRARFRRRTGMDLDEVVDADGLRRMLEGGFLIGDAEGLQTTPAGRLRLDAVLAQLLGAA